MSQLGSTKPRPWFVDQRRLSTRGRAFWRNLVFYAPLWEGGNTKDVPFVVDIAGHATGSITDSGQDAAISQDWIQDIQGTVWAAQGYHIIFANPSVRNVDFAVDKGWTVIQRAWIGSSTVDERGLFGRAQTTNDGNQITVRASKATTASLNVRYSGSNFSSSGVVVRETWFTWAVTLGNPAGRIVISIYDTDGVLLSRTQRENFANTFEFEDSSIQIAARHAGGTDDFDGRIDYTSIWNVTFDDAEIQQFVIDPYCLISPVRRRVYPSFAVAPSTAVQDVIGAGIIPFAR